MVHYTSKSNKFSMTYLSHDWLLSTLSVAMSLNLELLAINEFLANILTVSYCQ